MGKNQIDDITANPNEWSLIISGDLSSGGDCIIVEANPKQHWLVDTTGERVKLSRGIVTVYMSHEEYKRRFTVI